MSAQPDPLAGQLVTFSTMLAVRDLSVSEAFYTRHFGLRVSERADGLCRLQRPGVSLYLVEESPATIDKPTVALRPLPDRGHTPVNLVFRVGDVHATHRALSAGGLAFLAPPRRPPWGGWRCFAQDPDGYLIEIEQP